MKNDIKKYLTLGAALAGSALMVSCDGDDGATGATGPAGADGAAQYNLSVSAPAKELLPLGQFTLTVDSSSNTVFFIGDQLQFDVDTQNIFEYSYYDEDSGTGFTASGNISSQLGSWNTQAIVEGASTFSISDIDLDNDPTTSSDVGDLNIASLTFTPDAVSLGSQSGTFELVANPEQVNVNVDPTGLHETTVTNSPIADVVISYRNVTGNVIEITDPSSIAEDDLENDYVIFSTATTTYIAHLSASVLDAASVDLTGVTLSATTITTSNLGALAEGEFAELTIENPTAINISGVYRFDLDSSAGSDQSGATDPQR